MARINVNGFEFDNELPTEEILTQHSNFMKAKVAKEKEEEWAGKLEEEKNKWETDNANKSWLSQLPEANRKLADRLINTGLSKDDILKEYGDFFNNSVASAKPKEQPKINIASVIEEAQTKNFKDSILSKPVSQLSKSEQRELIKERARQRLEKE